MHNCTKMKLQKNKRKKQRIIWQELTLWNMGYTYHSKFTTKANFSNKCYIIWNRNLQNTEDGKCKYVTYNLIKKKSTKLKEWFTSFILEWFITRPNNTWQKNSQVTSRITHKHIWRNWISQVMDNHAKNKSAWIVGLEHRIRISAAVWNPEKWLLSEYHQFGEINEPAKKKKYLLQIAAATARSPEVSVRDNPLTTLT